MQRILNTLKTVYRETDKILLLLCVAASALGVLIVSSATMFEAEQGSWLSRDGLTMLLGVLLGLTAAIIISFIDYNLIFKLVPLIAGVCLLLMLATLAVGVGPPARPDAKTWLVLGSTGLYFQPSELLKIGFIITFGMHIELVQDRLSQFKHIVFLCLHAIVPIGLVIVSGDMGSALVFMIIFVVMMFFAGVGLRYFFIGIAGVCALLPFAWKYVLDDIQRNRFLGLLYPELYEDIMYQQEVGMAAIRNGGLLGQGLFNGEYTQAGIVPESKNDMVFSAFAEELGFIGGFVALALLVAIAAKLVYNGRKSRNNAASLMCYGMSAMIAGQMIINIGMCLMLLPVIGITLPFYSAGGSSNLCLYIGIGLMLSIYRFDKEQEITNFRYSRINTPFGN
ncbi:MAG: FtsW/RodA/SpoVE family cell cycle protein [Clostridia bacterium]|nr:FtsW/RodA/SpoVE family cell cycle protein [Clostridia bacterium]